jgi:hypothetical protein
MGTRHTLALVFFTMGYAQEQIHITYTGNPTEMAVDFASNSSECDLKFGQTGSATISNITSSSVFINEIGYQHQATMVNLEPNTSYSYSISCASGTSMAPREFWSTRVRADGMQRVLFFADFGLNNDVSMASLNQVLR